MVHICCEICSFRYDSSLRVPKKTACSHTFCQLCLEERAHQTPPPLRCPSCRSLILPKPRELPTDYACLIAASATMTAPTLPKSTLPTSSNVVGSQFYCDTCKEEAKKACVDGGHSLRGMRSYRIEQAESSRKAAQDYANVLEKVVPKLLHMGDIAKQMLQDTTTAQDEPRSLTSRLDAYTAGKAGVRLEDCQRDADEWALRMPVLERAVQLMSADRGTCRLELKGADAGASFTTTLNLGSIGESHPDILAVAQFLLYLLCKENYLQGGAATGRAPPRGGEQRNNGDAPEAVVTEDGILDLGPSGIGEAGRGQMAQQKAALLRSADKVTQLEGLVCSADPSFATKIIQKHAPHLETLSLRQVQQEHMNLLGSLRVISNLKLVRCDGMNISAKMPAQPDCVLKSLYVNLPRQLQLDLWLAFASSLGNVVLRVEATDVGMVTQLKRLCAVSPNLRNLHLHRKRPVDHTPAECAKQLTSVRAVVSPVINVTCNMCRGA